MEKNKEENHKECPNNAVSNWSFYQEKLKNQTEIVEKLAQPILAQNKISLANSFHFVSKFISELLKKNFDSPQVPEIINFLALVLQRMTTWSRNFSIEMDSELTPTSFIFICKIIRKVLGFDSRFLNFHENYCKFVPKKYAVWKGMNSKSSLNKLSLYFLSVFGKANGFEFILEMLRLKMPLEFLIDLSIFEIVKHLKKKFYEKWTHDLQKIITTRINSLNFGEIESMDYEKVAKAVENCSLIFNSESKDNDLILSLLFSVLNSGIKKQQIKAIQTADYLISMGKSLSSWMISKQVLEIIIESCNKSFYEASLKLFDHLGSMISEVHVLLLLESLKVSEIAPISSKIICSACQHLSAYLVSIIFKKFSIESPYLIQFSKDFTLAVINELEFPIEQYPVSYFKSLLTEQFYEYHSLALTVLTKIFAHFPFDLMVDCEIIECVQDLTMGIRSIENILLLLSLDENGLRIKNFINESDICKMISPIPNPLSPYPIKDQVVHKLRFLGFCFKANKMIEFSEFQRIWDTLSNSEYSDTFFQWVDEILINIPEITTLLFKENFKKKTSLQSMSLFEFKCFYKMFLMINSYERTIEFKQGNFHLRLQHTLKSFSLVIKVMLNGSEEIFRDCAMKMIALNTKFSPSLYEKRKMIWDRLFFILFQESGPSSYSRAITFISFFLNNPQTDSSESFLVMILFKTKEEKKFNKIYINEHSVIRNLRKSISEFYHKNFEETQLLRGQFKLDDETPLKELKSKLVFVEFSESLYLDIESFLNSSRLVQDWLLQRLDDCKDYSQNALEILHRIKNNFENFKALRELNISVEEILGKSIYKFLYFSNIIERLCIDKEWINKFQVLGGVKCFIEEYDRIRSQDFTFNKCMISVIHGFVCNFKEILSQGLIKRLFESFSEIALENSEKILETVAKFKNITELAFLGDAEIMEQAILHYPKLRIFIENCLIKTQSPEISEAIITILDQMLQMTMVFNTLLSVSFEIFDDVEKFMFSKNSRFFEFLCNLLKKTSNHPYYIAKTESKLLEIINKTQKHQINGFLDILSEFFQSIEPFRALDLLEKVLNEANCVTIWQPFREKFLNLMFKIIPQSPQILDLLFSKLLIPDWKIFNEKDWFYPSNLIDIGSFPYKIIKVDSLKHYLPLVLYHLNSMHEFVNDILTLEIGNSTKFLALLKKFFENFRISSKPVVSANKIAHFLQTEHNFFNKSNLDLNSFFKYFMKIILFEFSDIKSTKNLVFQGKFYLKNKNLENLREKSFSCINISINKRHIFEKLKKFFINEKKRQKIIGRKDFINNSDRIELPQVIQILLKRFKDDENGNKFRSDEYCEFPLEIVIENYKNSEDFSQENEYLYRLIGIVTEGDKNDGVHHALFSKTPNAWIKISGNQVKIIRNQKFYLNLFGKRSATENKSAQQSACILIYEKAERNQSVVASPNFSHIYSIFRLNNEIDISKICFFLCEEFIDFCLKLLISSKVIDKKLPISYFILYLIRSNNQLKIFEMLDNLETLFCNDPMSSQWLLEYIKTPDIQSLLFFSYQVPFKSKIISDLIISALKASRPSTSMRLLTHLISIKSGPNHYFSETFFETLYFICRINPILALEEGAKQKIFKFFNHITTTQNRNHKIPAFLFPTLKLFKDSLTSEEISVFDGFYLLTEILNITHNKFTAFETAVFLYEIFRNRPNLETFIEIIFANIKLHDQTVLDSVFLVTEGLLGLIKEKKHIETIVQKLMKFIEDQYSTSKIIKKCVECILNSVTHNELLRDYMYSETSILKILFEKINSEVFLDHNLCLFENSQAQKIDLICKLRKKINIECNAKTDRIEKVNFLIAFYEKSSCFVRYEVIRNFNAIGYIQIKNIYLLYDYLNKELIFPYPSIS